MKTICPDCQRTLRCQKERRFVSSGPSTVLTLDYTVLYLFQCSKRQGCGLSFMVAVDIPINASGVKQMRLCEDWELWKRATKTRTTTMSDRKTTASDFTLEIHSDTAKVWQRVLKRFSFGTSPAYPAAAH